jgi:DNA-binding LacI/PurR family transcriptional regulator
MALRTSLLAALQTLYANIENVFDNSPANVFVSIGGAAPWSVGHSKGTLVQAMKGIRQLARQLDMSIGTVSKALNGRSDVNEETRKRVLAAAAELGYVPNQSGRSLRRGTTNAIGFMIEYSEETAKNSDNFFPGVVEGVQASVSRHDLDLVILPYSNKEDPYDHLKRVVARGLVDALIISATLRVDPRLDLLNNAHIPFISLGRSTSVGNNPWIDLDFEGVADTAIDRFVAHGHRRIAVALPDNDTNLGYVFHDAYRSALSRNGLAYDPSLAICGRSSEAGGYHIGDELLRLEDRPTAILLVYEIMAMGLYLRLSEGGVIPGKDIAIIGFREGAQARFLSPSLTCFRTSLHDLGVTLGESLLATIPAFRDQYPQGTVQKVWPLELAAGESDAFQLLPS